MIPFFNKKTLLLLITLFLRAVLVAQPNNSAGSGVEMADSLYQSGKIYVVITVITVIFIGIIAYMILLDKKISKLERELKKE
ncbi:MAG TPA: CcmD family protein [Bacteroidia bacterium]|nr:CcmD family protein [Bacteroidia bacterium]